MPNVNNAYLPSPLDILVRSGIKVAIPDLIIEDESLPIDSMTDLIFADIGGQEILSMSRHDTIDSPLSRSMKISDSGMMFKKTKYVEPTDSINEIFASFQVQLNSKIPDSIEIPSTESYIDSKDNIYVSEDGSINIILQGMASGNKVQVDFFNASDIVNGTIY